MIRIIFTTLCVFLTTVGFAGQRINLDSNWKFALGHASNTALDFGYSGTFKKTAENFGTPVRPEFKDEAWQDVEVPHDWVVTLGPDHNKGEGTKGHGYKPVGPLYPETSIGWYRKRFPTPDAERVRLVFDGISRNADIWLNSFWLGNHRSGYIGASYDVTDFLNESGDNVLVVRVDATMEEGWWYEGAGIYRHVWLETFGNVDFTENGIFVFSELSNDLSSAGVKVEYEIESWLNAPFEGNLRLEVRSPEGKRVAADSIPLKIGADLSGIGTIAVNVDNPQLWNIENPVRYYADCTIEDKNGVVMSCRTVRFGIRRFEFDSCTGMFLNGKPVKIKGVCCHQDHAGVGIALPDFLMFYRIRLLKRMGANAYRCSHNPPAPELLEACDSLGMIVLDETRLTNSCPEYLNQFRQMVLRDRNHPSIFMWSIGNEEVRIQSGEQGSRIAGTFLRLLRKIDPTRLSTYAGNNGATFNGINSVVDVRGFNYGHKDIVKYHTQHPDQPVMGSEMASTLSTRGVVKNDSLKCYLSDQDINYPGWGSRAETWWKIAYENEWFMGGFVWTGFDYRGEPTPFQWPNISSHFGIMDVCGFPKNIYYYYRSWWTDEDFVHISPHWNRPVADGDSVTVWVNSNAEKISLWQDGCKIGTKEMPVAGHLEWRVRYNPGTLKAVGTKNGRTFSTSVSTTGAPSAVRMEVDKNRFSPDGKDGIVVDVCVVDRKGNTVPDACNYLNFNVEGGMRIIGVGNGDPSCHEPDKCIEGKWGRSLFSGWCQIIMQSNGRKEAAELTVSGDGLRPATVRFEPR